MTGYEIFAAAWTFAVFVFFLRYSCQNRGGDRS